MQGLVGGGGLGGLLDNVGGGDAGGTAEGRLVDALMQSVEERAAFARYGL